MTYSGGCLCGSVRYRATGKPIAPTHCHCETCRRVSGAAFMTWVSVAALVALGLSGGREAAFYVVCLIGLFVLAGTPLVWHLSRLGQLGTDRSPVLR